MRLLLTCAMASALVAAAPAAADTIYTGTFSEDQETVDTGSPGTGNGRVTLSDDGLSLTVQLDFEGLTIGAADAHIHCCAPLGANAPVAIGFSGAGFPLGETAGTFTATFDLTDIGVFSGGFLGANGGTVESARAALLGGLDAGLSYLNIHTANFPPGEIRAQLTEQDVDVPEPAAIGLLGLGLIGLGIRRQTARAKA